MSQKSVEAIAREYARAREILGPFHNAAEGWGVIAEEIDELWAEIKADAAPTPIWSGARQVAAMALAFAREVLDMGEEDFFRHVRDLKTRRFNSGHEAHAHLARCLSNVSRAIFADTPWPEAINFVIERDIVHIAGVAVSVMDGCDHKEG